MGPTPVPHHEIAPDEDMEVRFSGIGVDGRTVDVSLTAFRTSNDGEDAGQRVRALAFVKDDDGIEVEEVELARRVEVAKEVQLNFIQRHEKAVKIASAATALTFLVAASTGLIVHRHRRR